MVHKYALNRRKLAMLVASVHFLFIQENFVAKVRTASLPSQIPSLGYCGLAMAVALGRRFGLGPHCLKNYKIPLVKKSPKNGATADKIDS